jgi:NAD(P)-dependent dehydrogenase (short-subunit alcohol dehydrogenase family)
MLADAWERRPDRWSSSTMPASSAAPTRSITPRPTGTMCMQVNLKSVFFLCQAFAKRVFEAKRTGRIVNIGSLLSFQGGIRVAAYTASKHGVAGITQLLANEWAAQGHQRQRDCAGLYRVQQHDGAAPIPTARGDPRPHPGRALGAAGRHRRRRGVPAVGRHRTTCTARSFLWTAAGWPADFSGLCPGKYCAGRHDMFMSAPTNRATRDRAMGAGG